MPLVKLAFKPGINKDDSPLASEGGWIDADKVRFANGQPQTRGGWETVTTGTFTGIGRGGHTWVSNDAVKHIAWGTATKLYVQYGGTIYDITPVGLGAGLVDGTGEEGGYGTSTYGSGTYGTATTGTRVRTWALDNFGEDLLAVPRGGALYKWSPGDAAATVVAAAPVIIDTMFVDPNRIVVLGGTLDSTGVYSPLLVRNSEQEDYTNWTASSTTLAGEYPLANGSRIVCGRASRQQNLIWTDDALYTMQFTGESTTVYSYRLIGTGCGAIGPMAATEHNGAAYWMSNTNFMMFQGSVPQTIPCNLRRDVFANIATNQADKISCGVNPAFSEIEFIYPDGRDSGGANLECSRYVLYNFAEGHFTSGTCLRSTFIRPSVFPYPIMLGTDGYVYYHEKGYSANGDVLTAYLESAYYDIADGDKLVSLLSVVPDFDDQQGPVDFTITTKNSPNGSSSASSAMMATTATERLWLRKTGRQMKVRLDSSTTSSFWRLGSLRLDIKGSGSRR